MNICNCQLPESGERIYDCERLNCRMTPGFCILYETREDYRRAWDEGRGPAQANKPLIREQLSARSAKAVAIYESIRPIAERLAAETGEPSIVADALRYRGVLIKWKKARFPVRDRAEQKIITETICPGCCRYRNGRCGRYGGKGQLIVALAWIRFARCPCGVWELW